MNLDALAQALTAASVQYARTAPSLATWLKDVRTVPSFSPSASLRKSTARPEDILTAVPPQILQRVTVHLACLREFNAGIARMRALAQRVGSAGRYEFEYRLQREPGVQQSQAWLERFAALARPNGVDPDEVFTAPGGRR